MARPKTFDETAALDAAIGVFREHGFEGSSAGMLVDAMGIGRQSLYDTFGDKWGLYRLAVEHYGRTEVLAHHRQLRTGAKAIDGLRALLDRVVAEADQACLGVGSICEFGRTRDDLTAVHEASWRSLGPALVERVTRAQIEGDVSLALDPEAVADFFNATIAGIRIAARGGASPARLVALRDLALRSLA